MSSRKMKVQGIDTTLEIGVSGQRWGSFEVEPPNVGCSLHIGSQSTENPESCSPNPSDMIKSRGKAPGSRPGPGLEIQISQVVQYEVLLACQSTCNKQFVLMNHCSMSCP